MGLSMKKIFLMAISTIVLGGCNYLKPEQAPLAGERISVLQHERSISADAEVAGQQVMLPAPSPNLA